MTTLDYDAVILGAGSAGAATARMLVEKGRRVALVESRPFENGGASWVNDIPPWMFDRAGIERPIEHEKRCDHVPITLVGRRSDARLEAGLRPMWGVDMRKLTARLRTTAVEAGAEPFDRATLGDVVERHGRLTEIHVRAKRARSPEATFEDLTLRARLFVDATGIRQALLRRVPSLSADCPPPSDAEICTAHQQVREVTDRAGALNFLSLHGMSPGQVLTFTGLRGGYSTVGIIVEPNLEHVEVLTGVGGGTSHGRASQLLREIVRRERWIGPVVMGGGGRIPIRRPYDRLTAPGLALVGDSGCQVFPVHASGVGSGLIAARILEESMRAFDDLGSEAATWAYQSAFHRERGGVHAAYDVMRRASQQIDGETLDTLLATGLVGRGSTESAMAQRLHVPSASELARLARAAARAPRASAGLVWAALRMPAIQRAYSAFPAEPSADAFRAWARAVAVLCGHQVDGRRASQPKSRLDGARLDSC